MKHFLHNLSQILSTFWPPYFPRVIIFILSFITLVGSAKAQEMLKFEASTAKKPCPNLADLHNYQGKIVFIFDLQKNLFGYSVRDTVGTWKYTTYPIKDFFWDDIDSLQVAVIKTDVLDQISIDQENSKLKLEFYNGSECRYGRLRKIQ